MAIYVGIELDAPIVRAAIVRSQLGRMQIVRYVELEHSAFPDPEPTFDGAVPEPTSAQPGATPQPTSPQRRAVAEILRRAGAGAEVIASFPSEDLSLRRVELPAAAAKKADELVPFELEALIPFEAEVTLLDHQGFESGDPSKLFLLACAAPKARIRDRLEELAHAGLDPLALVPSAPALGGLTTFVPALAGDAPQLLVGLGGARTDLCVVRRGRTELARTVTVGALHVEEVGYGAPPPGTEAERLVRELKQTITAYRLQGGADPQAVWVVGAVDPSGMIVRWLASALDRSVDVLPLPDPAPTSSKVPEAPLDVVTKGRFAMPLALVGHVLSKQRYLDLRKGEFVRTRQLGLVRELAPLLGVAAAAIFVAWGFSVYAQFSVLKSRREVLESELARVSRTYLGQETTSITEARELLEQGRANPDPMPQWTALDALLAVSSAVPAGVRHDVQRLQIDLAQDRSEGHFELQGVVGTIEESDRVRAALAEIRCLQNLEQSGATTPAADGRRQYRLEAAIRCPDERRASDDSRRGRRRSRTGGASGASGGEGGAQGGGE
jgi:type II secretory pathway component PulL